MEFRKMVMITLYAKQKKRHRCTEQAFGISSFLNVEFEARFFTPLSTSSRSSLAPLYFPPLEWYHLHIWGWFLSSILIPTCDSSNLAFCMMYSAYKLNKQGDNIWFWCTPFPVLNQFIVPCLVLTVAYWPAYRFLRRQVRWFGISISLRIF